MLQKFLVVMAAGVAAFTLMAQPPGGGAGKGGKGGAKAGQTVEKIRELKPNLYMITGGGANTLVLVTPEGLVVADTKNPGDDNYNRVMEEIGSVSKAPVKYVINTQHHPDHVGTNQQFITAGAKVVAYSALKDFMASDPRTKDIPGRPTDVVGKDYTLKLGGQSVELHFYGAGHTGDDTMVYFPAQGVVMVSDQITDGAPLVDFANGGSAIHWNDSLNAVLKLNWDQAIPGRGEPKSKADVQAYADKFSQLVKRSQDAIKAGATKETLGMQVKTDDLGWTFNAAFWGSLYDELKK